MKKSIFSLLLLFAALFSANLVFAGEPIPGVNVAAGKNPGGQVISTTKTGSDGKFTLNLKEGKYDITLLYNDIQAVAKRLGKKWDAVTLAFDAGSSKRAIANGNALPAGFTITQTSKAITVSIPVGGATITGMLTGSSSVEQSSKPNTATQSQLKK